MSGTETGKKDTVKRTKCPHCDGIFRVPVKAIGRSIKCGKCGQPFIAGIYAPKPRPTPPPIEPATWCQDDGPADKPVRRVSGVGIASLSLGVVACVSCWLPILGGACVPVALIGIGFGAVGLVCCLFVDNGDLNLPISGIFVSLVAIIIFSCVSSWTEKKIKQVMDSTDRLVSRSTASEEVTGRISIDGSALMVSNGNSFAWFDVRMTVNSEYVYKMKMLPGHQSARIEGRRFVNPGGETLTLSDHADIDVLIDTSGGSCWLR